VRVRNYLPLVYLPNIFCLVRTYGFFPRHYPSGNLPFESWFANSSFPYTELLFHKRTRFKPNVPLQDSFVQIFLVVPLPFPRVFPHRARFHVYRVRPPICYALCVFRCLPPPRSVFFPNLVTSFLWPPSVSLPLKPFCLSLFLWQSFVGVAYFTPGLLSLLFFAA